MKIESVWSVWSIRADVFPKMDGPEIRDIEIALKVEGPWVDPDDAGLGAGPYLDVYDSIRRAYESHLDGVALGKVER